MVATVDTTKYAIENDLTKKRKRRKKKQVIDKLNRTVYAESKKKCNLTNKMVDTSV